MKKFLKTLAKIIIIDLIVVLLVSTVMVTKATINRQNIMDTYNDGKDSSEYPYICGFWTETYRCNLTSRLKESASMIPPYMIAGGFAEPQKNPYSAANYIFIFLLSGYLFQKEYRNQLKKKN